MLRVPAPIRSLLQALAASYRKAADTDPTGENLLKQVQTAITGRNPSDYLLAEAQAQLIELRAQLARGRAQLAEVREENARLLTRQQEKKPPKSFKGFGK